MDKVRRWSGCFTAALVAFALFSPVPASAESLLLLEAEQGIGDGQVHQRSAASGRHTVWLHAGESRRLPFTVARSGSFGVQVVYSNDNWGPLETVEARLDGSSIGQFQAEDTGDWGGGWNWFRSSGHLSSVALSAGPHAITLAVSGGDGRGVEIDVVQLEPQAGEVFVEAEAGEGDGQVMSRSAASHERTAWLHRGESRRIPFSLPAAGSYWVSVRYSNDNWGPLESVDVAIDGAPVGHFQAADTGDGGNGWQVFVWSESLGPASLADGPHEMTLTVSGGDNYGVEFDVVRLDLATT